MFGKKSYIDEDFFEWAVTLAAWTIDNFDGLDQLRKTKLVTPSAEFFPKSRLGGGAKAQELFEQVKAYADMADWQCTLQPQQERAPHHLGDSIMQKYHAAQPAGTFSEKLSDGNFKATITYDPHLIDRPIELIATFSHELAHLLMTSAGAEFPFHPDMEEPATDGLAILMGFGVFIANGSSGFRSDDQGWEYHRAGYLCEGEILHVLSTFLILSGNPIEHAKPYLKPHLYKRLAKIHKGIFRRQELLALAA
jgi:hypothetical protein